MNKKLTDYVIDLVDDKFYLKSGDTRIASYQL